MAPPRQPIALRSATLALLLAAVAVVAACAKSPLPANPALWRIDGPGGQRGFLFGTIHASPAPIAWRTPKVEAALADSDVVLVEIADLGDGDKLSATFARLSRSPNLPPLAERVPPGQRPALAALLKRLGMGEQRFNGVETWAAALTLATASEASGDPANGVDRAVIAAAPPRPVAGLETMAGQLSLFDRLPERQQRALLVATLAEASGGADLGAAWRKDDMAAIERATRVGILADPDLRAVLFTGRNEAWARDIDRALRAGRRPFVAVGAAHMAARDGLVALLRNAGYRVERVE